MLATTVARRALALAEPLRDRILAFRHDPPSVSLTTLLTCILLCLGLGAAAWFEAGWRRDAWWRAEIARSSAEVRTILRERGRTIVAGDEAAIEELKREKINAEAELEELRRIRKATPLADACSLCRIPADRLGVQQR
jgi:hypothetical protein